jgi:hypothetical protein
MWKSTPLMIRRFTRSQRVLLLMSALLQAAFGASPDAKSRNVMFVMTDGLRWQEVFRGADAALINKEHGNVSGPEELKKLYWRDMPAQRREALMPFLWQTIARYGQVYGNRDLGSDAYVMNGHNFSYPGYNETLCGFPDPRIDSNDKVPNPNVTVLEWLHRKPEYSGQVAGFGAWDVISAILNPARSGLVANAGYDPFLATPITPEIELINRLKADTRIWGDEPFDSFTFYTAMAYLKVHHPRVLYVSLGETDDWAHEGYYALYLNAAHRVDQFLGELWGAVQSMPEYRGSTTLIFSPDHGRGEAPDDWKSHGEKIPSSKYIWMAFVGPETPALGERAHIAPVTQSQIAATLAALLGEDYNADVPKAGKPIHDVLRPVHNQR